MADKIHLKQPNRNPNHAFPPNKPRPVYRPQALRARNRRSVCCCCCLWVTLTILVLIIFAAAAGCMFYVLYSPQRPSFTVSSLQVSQFNITSTNKLNTKFNFTVTARNPNKKIEFGFDRVTVGIDSNGVDVGEGSIPGFVMVRKNTTRLRTIVAKSGESVEESSGLRSELKSKKSLWLVIRLDTKVKVKIGGLETKKVPIRVVCRGIRVRVPVGRLVTSASTDDVECKVDVRIKIWKWTI